VSSTQRRTSARRTHTTRSDRNEYLIRRYGITSTEYEKILTSQGGTCAICGRNPRTRRLAVDHDHRTGKVRGLLCWTCNKKVIGNRNDPAIFDAAAAYLRSADQRILTALERSKPRIALVVSAQKES